MTVKQLIQHLQTLPTELQDAPVTFVRDDFPRLIGRHEVETAYVYGDHYHVEYAEDAEDWSEEQLFKIVILREGR